MHARSLECIFQLRGAPLRCFQVGVNDDNQEGGRSPAENGAARLNLPWILVADVLLSAAAWAPRERQEAEGRRMSASFQVATNQILLLEVFSEDDLVCDPLRHSPTPGR